MSRAGRYETQKNGYEILGGRVKAGRQNVDVIYVV